MLELGVKSQTTALLTAASEMSLSLRRLRFRMDISKLFILKWLQTQKNLLSTKVVNLKNPRMPFTKISQSLPFDQICFLSLFLFWCAPQFGFVSCFLSIWFKLSIFGRNTTEVTCSQCRPSGGMTIDLPHYFFVHLGKVVSVKVVHGKFTVFPFLGINTTWGDILRL